MITWQATIKERSRDNLLKPLFSIGDGMFGHIKNKRHREYEMKKFLREFWGLDNPDVEWYKLEKV